MSSQLLRPLLIAGLVAVLVNAGALAQEQAVQTAEETPFHLLPEDAMVVGSLITIDADFGAQHELEVPAPFTFLIPTADGIEELLEPAPRPGEAFVKINFATPERELIENLQFVPFTIPLGSSEERLNALGELLANEAFGMAVDEYDSNRRDLVRPIKVNQYDGVEVIGRYEDHDLGLMYLRIVGILNPDSEHGVVAISNVVSSMESIPAPNDFPRTRSGTALNSFEFVTP